ncbi:MAG: ATPase, T2SS/T4P/T4SS family [bacterium]|nr:ATPase, T2SS/T4P/T4SS family [bacterium]
MHVDESELESFILDSGLVSAQELGRVKERAGERGEALSQALVQTGTLVPDDLRRAQSYILSIPFVSLKDKKVDFEILSLIPEPLSRTHNVIAFSREGRDVEVALLDVGSIEEVDFLKKDLDIRILPRLTDSDSMKWALLLYQQGLHHRYGESLKKHIAILKDSSGGFASETPAELIVETLINHALSQSATDIHLEPTENGLLARYRINGRMHDALTLPSFSSGRIFSRIKLLAGLDIKDELLPQDGRFTIEREGDGALHVRVATIPEHIGEKVVMRLFRDSAQGFSLESLGLRGHALEDVHQALKAGEGLILAAGPSSSGRTTTLYTFLDILNTPRVSISTVEDSVEYKLNRVNQTQVRPELGLTAEHGLRAVIRQTPDVLMLGELKGRDEAKLLLSVSSAGCLALSSVSANSAAGALVRLVEQGVDPLSLASSLNVVTAQHLVRRLSGPKVERYLNKEELGTLSGIVSLERMLKILKSEGLVAEEVNWDSVPFWRVSDEAPQEEPTYIAVYEAMRITPAIRTLMMNGATAIELENQARENGMITLIEDGIIKAVAGVTTLEAVLGILSE